MRQWWNKLPMYAPEGKGRAPLVVVQGDFASSRGRRHQEEPDDDDDDGGRPAPKKKAKEQETEEITLNGKKYTVPKGFGEEMQKAGAKGTKIETSSLAQIRSMFEEMLDTRVGKPKKQAKKQQIDDDEGDDDGEDDALMFTDPKAWKKKFAENIRKEVLNEVRTSYTADQSQRDFWKSFYSKNEDLEAYDFIVKAVLQENGEELLNMETRAASKKLAEYTREKLIEIGRKATGKKGKGNDGSSHVEGSGTARSRGQDNDEQDESDQDAADRKAGMPMTLGALIKARKAERRAGGRNSTAEE